MSRKPKPTPVAQATDDARTAEILQLRVELATVRREARDRELVLTRRLAAAQADAIEAMKGLMTLASARGKAG